MSCLSSMNSALRRAWLSACLALGTLLGALGCADPEEHGGTLYVFDQGSASVLAFKDVNALHDAARDGKKLPEPDRILRSGLLNGLTVAWGGMAVDDAQNRLYLVSERGKVIVVNQPGTRKGTLSDHTEITSFTLGAPSDPSRPTVFGQASVDPANNILYVLENDRNGKAARVWQVADASRVAHGATLERQEHTLKSPEERWGIGVAAGAGQTFYGLFGSGTDLTDLSGKHLTGPRLREGQGSAFPGNAQNHPVKALIGAATRLHPQLRYGSLAFDSGHHAVYALVPPVPGEGAAKAGILVFGAGQFHGHHDQAPQRSLPEVPSELRVLAQTPHSEWLLGAAFTPATGNGARPGQGQGTPALYLWKTPGEDKPPVKIPNLPGATEIRGMGVATK
jgi:hypothetical protein